MQNLFCMLKNFKHIIYILFVIPCLLFLLNESSFAIEQIDNSNKKEIINELVFDDVIKKSIDNSYELQMADFDILIAKYGINEAKAEYLPKIGLSVGTEYNKSFKDSPTPSVTVGDTFINPYTRYQTMGGITLFYNIFDFGIRSSMLKLAKEDVTFRTLMEKEDARKVQMTVIDLYGRIYVLNEQLKTKKEILALEENSLHMKKRLYKAKEISLIELKEQQAKVEKTKKELSNLYGLLEENLAGLSFFTCEDYDAKKIKVHEITPIDYQFSDNIDYQNLTVAKIYDSAHKKKEFELLSAKRTNYPKVNFYTKYYMYGSDVNNYGGSYGDFGPSNWAIGASASMTPFDGGKVRSKVKKLELEVKKIEIEKKESLAELKKQIYTLKANLNSNSNQLEASNDLLRELGEKESATQLLCKNRLVSPIDLNMAKVNLLEEKIENLKYQTSVITIERSLKVLTTPD